MTMRRRDLTVMNHLTLICAISFLVLSIQLGSVLSCTADEFECSNGDCIPQAKRCDNSFDCPDASDTSDESNCTSSDVCVESQIRCPDGSCAAALDECPMSTEPSDDTTTEKQGDVTTESQNVVNGPQNNKESNDNDNGTSGGSIFGYFVLAVLILYTLICFVLYMFLKTGQQGRLRGLIDNLQELQRLFKSRVEPQKTYEKQDTDLNSNKQPIINGNIPPQSTNHV